MAEYFGRGGVARKANEGFVGIAGVARKVKEGFVGVDGVARRCFRGPIKISGENVLVRPGEAIAYGQTITGWSKVTGWVRFQGATASFRYGTVTFMDQYIGVSATSSPYTRELDISAWEENQWGEDEEVFYAWVSEEIGIGISDLSWFRVDVDFRDDSFMPSLAITAEHGESTTTLHATSHVSYQLTFYF